MSEHAFKRHDRVIFRRGTIDVVGYITAASSKNHPGCVRVCFGSRGQFRSWVDPAAVGMWVDLTDAVVRWCWACGSKVLDDPDETTCWRCRQKAAAS